MSTVKYYVIESEEQYKEYCNILKYILWEIKLKTDEDNKDIKLLTLLIETWEEEHSTLNDVIIDPVQLLEYLMGGRYTPLELSENLNITIGEMNDILNYKIYMSKRIITILCDIFKMRESAFNKKYRLNPCKEL